MWKWPLIILGGLVAVTLMLQVSATRKMSSDVSVVVETPEKPAVKQMPVTVTAQGQAAKKDGHLSVAEERLSGREEPEPDRVVRDVILPQ